MQHRKSLEWVSVSLSRILLYGISYSDETLANCGKVVGSTCARPETLTTADNVSHDYMVLVQHFCSKLTWLVIQEDFISSRKSVKALQLTKHNYVNKACSCTSHV